MNEIIYEKVVDPETAKKFCKNAKPPIKIDFNQVIEEFEESYQSDEKKAQKLTGEVLKKLFPNYKSKDKPN